MLNEITSDGVIPKPLKNKIRIACAVVQAPAAIRGISEIYKNLNKVATEAENAKNLSGMTDKGKQNLTRVREILTGVGATADEAADAAEIAIRSVGLSADEIKIVGSAGKGIAAIPNTGANADLFYLAIHGEGDVFRIFHGGEWVNMSHRSLAKWVTQNVAPNKKIVLLSCSSSNSAQNLANKLGSRHTIIAWEGNVEIFESGLIKGYGKCKEFSAGNQSVEILSNNIPIGKTGAIAQCKSVFLGRTFAELLGDVNLYKGLRVRNDKITERLLTVGEGNFGFTKSLVDNPINTSTERLLITATEYRQLNQLVSPASLTNIPYLQQLGVRILGGVDANRLSTHFLNERFRTIFFNFPFVPNATNNGGNILETVYLLKNFFYEADKLTDTGGLIYITHTEEWFTKLRIYDQCSGTNFKLIRIKKFDTSQFPSYVHERSFDTSTTPRAMTDGYTFIFEKQ